MPLEYKRPLYVGSTPGVKDLEAAVESIGWT